MGQKPGECQFKNRVPVRLRVFDQCFDFIEIVVGKKLSVALEFRDTRVLGNWLPLTIFARQQPAHQGKEREKRQSFALAFRQYLILRFAMQQAVFVLHTDESCRSTFFSRSSLSIPDLLRRKVRAAYLANLTGFDEIIERSEGIRDRYLRIGHVLLI